MMKNKAIFLDRDGVINKEIGRYVAKADEFVLNDGVLQALQAFKNSGYLLIMITNQGGVSRGLYTKETLESIHAVMNNQLKSLNIAFDEIYICPHHDKMENCLCRKPKSLMIEKAVSRFNIDVKQSFLIGDSDRDIAAAENVGIKGIKLKSNTNLLHSVQDILNV